MASVSERHSPAHLSAALTALFPAGVVAAELRESIDVSLLHDAERQCVRRAAPKRLQEFAAGRLCARRALQELGIEDFPLLAAADRQPLWPDTVVGSITHTKGYCGVVAGARRSFAGLGLDTEVADAVAAHLWRQICTPTELERLQSLPTALQTRTAALIFSAKEAFYKCQYPLTQQWLEFADVVVESADWARELGAFTVSPQRSLQLGHGGDAALQGCFRFHEQFVSCGVALRPRDGADMGFAVRSP